MRQTELHLSERDRAIVEEIRSQGVHQVPAESFCMPQVVDPKAGRFLGQVPTGFTGFATISPSPAAPTRCVSTACGSSRIPRT